MPHAVERSTHNSPVEEQAARAVQAQGLEYELENSEQTEWAELEWEDLHNQNIMVRGGKLEERLVVGVVAMQADT